MRLMVVGEGGGCGGGCGQVVSGVWLQVCGRDER